KPANILLQKETTNHTNHTNEEKTAFRLGSYSCDSCDSWLDYSPRITDFGLARHLLAGGSRLTFTGQVLGTPGYIAPEQAAGGPDALGPAGDVYPLGAILSPLLCGTPPFRGANPLETLQQQAREEPVPPRRLQPRTPLDLEVICLKCLARDPRRRYQSP